VQIGGRVVIGAFNSVYTALQGFFSRSFWFATFLPVALFAALHAIIAAATLGTITLFGVSVSLTKEIPAASLAQIGPAIVIGLIVIGYALLPFMPRFRGLLDGSLLPTWLHDWLRDARQQEAKASLNAVDAARDDLGVLNAMSDEMYDEKGAVLSAYEKAKSLRTASDSTSVDTAERTLEALKTAIAAKAPIKPAAEAAQRAVIAALTVNNPDPKILKDLVAPVVVSDHDQGVAKRTNAAADLLEELLANAARETVYRYMILQTRIRTAGALKNPSATAIGDARFVVERYARDVYQVDFNFLWPRLLVAMKAEKADDPMLDTVENARAKVDFAVLSLVLAASVPAVWLPSILIRGEPAWLFMAIGAATPLVLGFFYGLVFEGQLAFGEVVKATIDKSRFLVLKMLRQPEPATRSEERALWARIAKAEQDCRMAELIYTPPAPIKG
jgi:hypothetical protein